MRRAPARVPFVVSGNGRLLEAAGISVLEKKAIKISRNEGDFWLAGLADQRAFKKNGDMICPVRWPRSVTMDAPRS